LIHVHYYWVEEINNWGVEGKVSSIQESDQETNEEEEKTESKRPSRKIPNAKIRREEGRVVAKRKKKERPSHHHRTSNLHEANQGVKTIMKRKKDGQMTFSSLLVKHNPSHLATSSPQSLCFFSTSFSSLLIQSSIEVMIHFLRSIIHSSSSIPLKSIILDPSSNVNIGDFEIYLEEQTNIISQSFSESINCLSQRSGDEGLHGELEDDVLGSLHFVSQVNEAHFFEIIYVLFFNRIWYLFFPQLCLPFFPSFPIKIL